MNTKLQHIINELTDTHKNYIYTATMCTFDGISLAEYQNGQDVLQQNERLAVMSALLITCVNSTIPKLNLLQMDVIILSNEEMGIVIKPMQNVIFACICKSSDLKEVANYFRQ